MALNDEEQELLKDGFDQFLRNKMGAIKIFFDLKDLIAKQKALSIFDEERLPDMKIIGLEKLIPDAEKAAKDASERICEALKQRSSDGKK